MEQLLWWIKNTLGGVLPFLSLWTREPLAHCVSHLDWGLIFQKDGRLIWGGGAWSVTYSTYITRQLFQALFWGLGIQPCRKKTQSAIIQSSVINARQWKGGDVPKKAEHQ